jgi:hypothetical protein
MASVVPNSPTEVRRTNTDENYPVAAPVTAPSTAIDGPPTELPTVIRDFEALELAYYFTSSSSSQNNKQMTLDTAELYDLTATHVLEALRADFTVDVIVGVNLTLTSVRVVLDQEPQLLVQLLSGSIVFASEEDVLRSSTVNRIVLEAFQGNALELYILRLKISKDSSLREIEAVVLSNGEDTVFGGSNIFGQAKSPDNGFEWSGAMIAIVVSVGVALLVVCLFACILCSPRRARPSRKAKEGRDKPIGVLVLTKSRSGTRGSYDDDDDDDEDDNDAEAQHHVRGVRRQIDVSALEIEDDLQSQGTSLYSYVGEDERYTIQEGNNVARTSPNDASDTLPSPLWNVADGDSDNVQFRNFDKFSPRNPHQYRNYSPPRPNQPKGLLGPSQYDSESGASGSALYEFDDNISLISDLGVQRVLQLEEFRPTATPPSNPPKNRKGFNELWNDEEEKSTPGSAKRAHIQEAKTVRKSNLQRGHLDAHSDMIDRVPSAESPQASASSMVEANAKGRAKGKAKGRASASASISSDSQSNASSRRSNNSRNSNKSKTDSLPIPANSNPNSVCVSDCSSIHSTEEHQHQAEEEPVQLVSRSLLGAMEHQTDEQDDDGIMKSEEKQLSLAAIVAVPAVVSSHAIVDSFRSSQPSQESRSKFLPLVIGQENDNPNSSSSSKKLDSTKSVRKKKSTLAEWSSEGSVSSNQSGSNKSQTTESILMKSLLSNTDADSDYSKPSMIDSFHFNGVGDALAVRSAQVVVPTTTDTSFETYLAGDSIDGIKLNVDRAAAVNQTSSDQHNTSGAISSGLDVKAIRYGASADSSSSSACSSLEEEDKNVASTPRSAISVSSDYLNSSSILRQSNDNSGEEDDSHDDCYLDGPSDVNGYYDTASSSGTSSIPYLKGDLSVELQGILADKSAIGDQSKLSSGEDQEKKFAGADEKAPFAKRLDENWRRLFDRDEKNEDDDNLSVRSDGMLSVSTARTMDTQYTIFPGTSMASF